MKKVLVIIFSILAISLGLTCIASCGSHGNETSAPLETPAEPEVSGRLVECKIDSVIFIHSILGLENPDYSCFEYLYNDRLKISYGEDRILPAYCDTIAYIPDSLVAEMISQLDSIYVSGNGKDLISKKKTDGHLCSDPSSFERRIEIYCTDTIITKTFEIYFDLYEYEYTPTCTRFFDNTYKVKRLIQENSYKKLDNFRQRRQEARRQGKPLPTR